MYDSIHDLPFVCQLNLPEAALKLYREAFNRAWKQAGDIKGRHAVAQSKAWLEVREHFERDKETGRWVPRATTLKPVMANNAQKRSAQ